MYDKREEASGSESLWLGENDRSLRSLGRSSRLGVTGTTASLGRWTIKKRRIKSKGRLKNPGTMDDVRQDGRPLRSDDGS
jgi:hypothetical protein